MVALGNVSRQIDRTEKVRPDADYRLLGMRSKIGGPFVRETKKGAEISAPKLNKVRAGDFIYSRLFAWQGSFGLIPPEMDGCYVSNEFPLFELDRKRVKPEFLVYWFGLPHVQNCVESHCSGSTPGTRNRYKETFFQNLEVPLPSLERQKFLVQHIQYAIRKVDEANRLRAEIQTDAKALLRSALGELIDGVPYRPMAEVAPIVRRRVDVDMDHEYQELGVRSFGNGVFHKPIKRGIEVTWQKYYRVRAGDLLFAIRKAWEGAVSFATQQQDNGIMITANYHVCEPVENVTNAKFLSFYFLNEGLQQIQDASTGTADRNRIISMKRLEALQVPVPTYNAQLKFNALQDKVAAIRRAQEESQTELDALFPSILDRAFAGVF